MPPGQSHAPVKSQDVSAAFQPTPTSAYREAIPLAAERQHFPRKRKREQQVVRTEPRASPSKCRKAPIQPGAAKEDSSGIKEISRGPLHLAQSTKYQQSSRLVEQIVVSKESQHDMRCFESSELEVLHRVTESQEASPQNGSIMPPTPSDDDFSADIFDSEVEYQLQRADKQFSNTNIVKAACSTLPLPLEYADQSTTTNLQQLLAEHADHLSSSSSPFPSPSSLISLQNDDEDEFGDKQASIQDYEEALETAIQNFTGGKNHSPSPPDYNTYAPTPRQSSGTVLLAAADSDFGSDPF